MLISASRRTDIPAFHSRWFANRLEAGFCEVANPFRPSQRSRVSLAPEDVSGFCFWTRAPGPLLSFLPELDRRGYRFFFLFTLLDYPRALDPGTPPLERRIELFQRLAHDWGPDRVIWRYDPVVFTETADPSFHARTFERLAQRLEGRASRVILSLFQPYRKNRVRMRALAGLEHDLLAPTDQELADGLASMAASARQHGFEPQTCAEEADLSAFGIPAGACIDPAYLRERLGFDLPEKRDPHQRELCRCAHSKDIGAYDSCGFGCAYCYATSSPERARRLLGAMDPLSPCLEPYRT